LVYSEHLRALLKTSSMQGNTRHNNGNMLRMDV
jgi:hypothetical protein